MIYIIFLFFTLMILAFGFYQWQYFMVFTPAFHRSEILDDRCQMLSIFSEDGIELEGVIYQPEKPISTILFFAGRNHDVIGVIDKLICIYPMYRIVTFNYRSYGKSGGVADEETILRDSLHIAYLVQKNYGDFYLLGFSLGSSIASYVASKCSTKGLFLVGAFDSISLLAKTKYVDKGILPDIDISKFFRYKFETIKYVQNVDASTYIFVSKNDETTYIQNSRNLKNKVKHLSYYVEFDNLSHKDILWDKRVVSKIKEVIG